MQALTSHLNDRVKILGKAFDGRVGAWIVERLKIFVEGVSSYGSFVLNLCVGVVSSCFC